MLETLSSHAVFCPKCRKSNPRPINQGRCQVSCSYCQATFLDLGPMPIPDLEIPTMSVLNPELEVKIPAPKSIEDLPKYLCPWCGGNAGVREACRRCGCDLTVCATVDMKSVAQVLTDEGNGVFYQQAMMPMTGDVALCRLHRLSPAQVRKISGTPALAAKMGTEPPPPGCSAQGGAKRKGCLGVAMFGLGLLLIVAMFCAKG